LLLLCQGLLFESPEENQSAIVLAFGILVVIMVVSCILLTAVFLVARWLNRNDESTLLLSKITSRKLPRDILFEAYLLNTLTQIEETNELWIDMNTWRGIMTRSEYENLMAITSKEHLEPIQEDTNVLQNILWNHAETKDNSSGKETFAVGFARVFGFGGSLERNGTLATTGANYESMLKEYQTYHATSSGMIMRK
jgi:hypothetical protein